MKPVECPYEAEVLAAVLEARWPEHVDATLREHAASCALCAEVAAVAGAMSAALEPTRACAALPDANQVWWRAQLRARREAVEAAGRPITAIQLVAFACAVGLLGACFGATSTWFQAALKKVAANVASFDGTAFLTAMTTLFAEHGVLVLGLVAVIFLVPTAVYVALGRD